MYEYLNSSNTTNIVGSFAQDKNKDFKEGVKVLYENFASNYRMDVWEDCVRILKDDSMREDYKQQLLGDVLEESYNDAWYDMHKDKVEQLFENTALEIVTESQMGMMNPIVGFTLPILKKNYYENVSKDIVLTEVPDKPFIKVAFERSFLKDREGNKYYIPEAFYDESYKKVYAKAKGTPINDTFVQVPMTDYDVLGASSIHNKPLEYRESLAYDFCIAEVKVEVEAKKIDGGGEETETVKHVITGLNIQPDYAAAGTFHYKIKGEVPATERTEATTFTDIIFGQVDSYYGTVTVAAAGSIVKEVKFGGHLSNENNEHTVELDYERETREFKIEDGERLNTGLTLEKIKDTKALLNIDITSKVITDMTTVLTNFEDNNILDFLDNSFETWKNKKDLPFGYGGHIANGKFVEQSTFSCVPPAGTMVTQSQYIDSEMKFNIDRLLDQLKVKLNNKDCMFVIYAHPNNITLLNNNVKWIVDEDTKIGGSQLEYRFGVLTNSKTRVHVVSSQKVPQRLSMRIVAYPLTEELITFKHYKYSLNIENMYRNPNTPLIPNIMATQRYKTIELLPVQGAFKLTNNGFGLADRDQYLDGASVGEVQYPR